MIIAVQDDQAPVEMQENPCEDSVETLSRLASSAQLCRSADGRLYAEVSAGGRREFAELRSRRFRDWLVRRYSGDQSQLPSSLAVRDVVSVLEDRARFDSRIPSLFVRVGREAGIEGDCEACYLDVGDADGRAIWICGECWFVLDRPGVRFLRPEGMLPLPIPSRHGSINLLRSYVNLREPDFRQLVVWLTAALRPAGPYPILALYGEAGSAKSTLATLVRLLIDPQDRPLLAQPRNTRELMSTAVNGWLLAYDNLSAIPEWLSDSLCRLADGGGFLSRARLSGDAASVINAQRPAVLSGMDDFVRRGDLSDRCVFLHLPRLSPNSRRTQAEYWASFQCDYPRILGGLLDAVVVGLRVLPALDLPAIPRMADFAYWGEAVSRGLGWAPEMFLSLYCENRREATDDALEDSVLGSALLHFCASMRWFEGMPSRLFQTLTADGGQETASSNLLPKTPSWLSRELRRLAPRLRTHGYSMTFGMKGPNRWITISPDGERSQYGSGQDEEYEPNL